MGLPWRRGGPFLGTLKVRDAARELDGWMYGSPACPEIENALAISIKSTYPCQLFGWLIQA
jgi:hypothetical protein